MKPLWVMLSFLVTGAAYAQDIDAKFINQPYAKFREAYVAKGYTAISDEPGNDKNFPEIACGQGMDAVCSAGFSSKDGKSSIAVLVSKVDGKWMVTGSY